MTNLKKLALATLAAAFIPAVAFADDAYNSQPAAAPLDEYVPRTCEEAQRDAWLIREMKRTDGDVNPEIDAVPECNNAKS